MEFIRTTLYSKNDNPVFIAKTATDTMLAEKIADNIYIIYNEHYYYAYDSDSDKTIAPHYLLNTILYKGAE